jgi:hypothetical protein
MLLEFLSLCFATTLDIREINVKKEQYTPRLSIDLIKELTENFEFDCLAGKDIYAITPLRNGSSTEAVFRVETDNGIYIIKSTRAPFAKGDWREILYIQSRGKSAELEIVSPEQSMKNFISLASNSELAEWNAAEQIKKNGIRFLVSLPIELVKVKVNENHAVLHLEIFPAAEGKSLVECIQEPDKTHCAELFRKFGLILARFHKTTGLRHGDLNLNNVFVSPNGSTFTLIDGNSIHADVSSHQNIDVEKLLRGLDNATVEFPSRGIKPLIGIDQATSLATAFKEGYYGEQTDGGPTPAEEEKSSYTSSSSAPPSGYSSRSSSSSSSISSASSDDDT